MKTLYNAVPSRSATCKRFSLISVILYISFGALILLSLSHRTSGSGRRKNPYFERRSTVCRNGRIKFLPTLMMSPLSMRQFILIILILKHNALENDAKKIAYLVRRKCVPAAMQRELRGAEQRAAIFAPNHLRRTKRTRVEY